MSVMFKTETINLNELVKKEKNMILIEGDVIVPDVCPDIREVLSISTRPMVSHTEANGARVTVSGTICANILYVPEKAENIPQLKGIDTCFDFSDIFDCGTENPQLSLTIDTENITYTLLNSRKLNIKITCAVGIKSYTASSYDFAVETDTDCDAEINKKTISLCNTCADTQKDFSFSETIEVPASKSDIEEILKTDVKIIKGDCKFSDGKILLRGTLNIATLYSGFEDGYITEYMEHEIPFGEVVDADIPTENCMCNIKYGIKELTAAVRNDLNGDPRVLEISMIICAEIMSTTAFEMEIIDDCYVPGKECTLKKENKLLKRCVNEGISKVSDKFMLSLPENGAPVMKVMNTNIIPKIRKTMTENDKLKIMGDITAVIIYREAGDAGEFRSLIRELPFEHEIDVDDITSDMDISCDVCLMGASYNIVSDKEIELRANLEFYIRVTELIPTDIITECNTEELSDVSKNSPQLIVYFAAQGDTLWNVAKKYNIAVNKIAKSNKLDDEITAGMKILIPR